MFRSMKQTVLRIKMHESFSLPFQHLTMAAMVLKRPRSKEGLQLLHSQTKTNWLNQGRYPSILTLQSQLKWTILWPTCKVSCQLKTHFSCLIMTLAGSMPSAPEKKDCSPSLKMKASGVTFSMNKTGVGARRSFRLSNSEPSRRGGMQETKQCHRGRCLQAKILLKDVLCAHRVKLRRIKIRAMTSLKIVEALSDHPLTQMAPSIQSRGEMQKTSLSTIETLTVGDS